MNCLDVLKLADKLLARKISPIDFIDQAGGHVFGTGDKPGCSKCLKKLNNLNLGAEDILFRCREMLEETKETIDRLDKKFFAKK